MASLEAALSRQYARVPLGMRLGLSPMREVCARAGHPERAFRAVHIAGTNGKGSVCAMVESITRATGIRTGLYTSPHLCRFAERIRVDGASIGDEALAALLTRALDEGPDLSFFETATLAAFLAFREAGVELAVLEVGLGGRLDATNVVPRPATAAITRIAFDHMDKLGSTLVEIAREKAGIAKPGLELLVGDVSPEVRAAIDEVARAHGATTASVGPWPLPASLGLPGAYQRNNARIAAALGQRIGASPAQIALLRKLLEETIAIGPGSIGFTNFSSEPLGARRANDSVIFYYFDEHQPAEGAFALPLGKTYTAEYVDTLKLTRTPLPGVYSGNAQVKLPGTPWGSLWFREKGVS